MARSCSHSSLLENLATMTWSACVSPSGSAYFKFTDVRIAVFPGNVPRITCTANLAQVRFLPGFKQACLVKAAGPGDDELSATGSCFALLQLTTIDIRTKTVRRRFIWCMAIPVIRIKKRPHICMANSGHQQRRATARLNHHKLFIQRNHAAFAVFQAIQHTRLFRVRIDKHDHGKILEAQFHCGVIHAHFGECE